MNSPSSPNSLVFKSRRSTRTLFVVFGLILSLLALLVLLLPLNDWTDFVFAFLFLVSPCGGFGWYFLRAWWLLYQARVEVSQEGVALNIPTFKAGWFFRGEPVRLRWDEICCVEHDRYALMQGGKPIDEYWIHSTRGNFALTKDVCVLAEEVVRLISTYKRWDSVPISTPAPLQEASSAEQDEAQLKSKAVASLLILLGVMLASFLLVMQNAPLLRKIEAGMAIFGHLFNLLFIVMTVASIFGLWWKARRERIGIQKLKERL